MSEERIQRAPLVWEPLAAVACFIGAVLSLAIGFVFTTHWLLDDHLHPLLHALGLLLLVIGIPIMILGGHFMDLREKKLHDSKSINH
jgi:Na+-transporting NADH:ubiquinone oxidoreductase subunit NqrE